MLENGWKFSIPGGQVPSEDFPQATQDKLFGSKYMKEIYFKADPGESFFFLIMFSFGVGVGARELWFGREMERLRLMLMLMLTLVLILVLVVGCGGYAGVTQSTTLGTPVSTRCPGSTEL
jgi:hypothetical protein